MIFISAAFILSPAGTEPLKLGLSTEGGFWIMTL